MLAARPRAKVRTDSCFAKRRFSHLWPIVVLPLILTGCSLLPSWKDLSTLGGLLSSEPNPHDLTEVRSANYTAPTPAAPVVEQRLRLSDAITDSLRLDLSSERQSLLVTARRDHIAPLDSKTLAALEKDAGYPTIASFFPTSSTAITPDAETSNAAEDRAFDTAQSAWNGVDFALAYATLRSGLSRDMLANALRRRAISNVVQQVQMVYWHAAAAVDVDGALAKNARDIQETLSTVRSKLVKAGQPGRNLVKLERRLLADLLTVSREKKQVQKARRQLANLANVPANGLKVESPSVDTLKQPEIGIARPELYRLAWEAQPELHHILDTLPPVTPLQAPLADGVKSALDVLRQYQPASDDVTAQRDAVKRAFAARVELALYQYDIAQRLYQKAMFDQLLDKTVSASTQTAGASDLARKVSKLNASVTAIGDALRIYDAYADVRAAYARLQDATGLTALPSDFPVGNAFAVTQQITLHERNASRSLALLAASLGRMPSRDGQQELQTKLGANAVFIDLGTYVDEARARTHWSHLYANYPDVLKKAKPEIRQVQTPKKGVQLLIRAPFGNNICLSLVSHGEYCLPYLGAQPPKPAVHVAAAQPTPPPPSEAMRAPKLTSIARTKASHALVPAAAVSKDMVQLGAFRRQRDADTAWHELQRRFPAELAGKTPRFTPVTLANGARLIRLRVAAADDETLCSTLQADGTACMAVARGHARPAQPNPASTPAPRPRPDAAPPAEPTANAVAVRGPHGSMRLVRPNDLCAAFAVRNLPCQLAPP